MDIGIAPTNDALKAYEDLKTKKAYRYIIFKAEQNNIVVEKLGAKDAKYEQFLQDLNPNEPRYCVYDYFMEYDDGRKAEKLVYIFWSPDTAKIQQKMIAATCNQSFKSKISGIAHFLEAHDFEEVSDKNIEKTIGKV